MKAATSRSGSSVCQALQLLSLWTAIAVGDASLPSRDRVVKQRQAAGLYSSYRDNGLPIDGNNYRTSAGRQNLLLQDDSVSAEREKIQERKSSRSYENGRKALANTPTSSASELTRDASFLDDQQIFETEEEALRAFPFGRTGAYRKSPPSNDLSVIKHEDDSEGSQNRRVLGSQLTGCCYSYKSYDAESMCSLYGEDCESGGGQKNSHDNNDGKECSLEGLSFIGVSFSVNTAYGNRYSYQLNDQFPMHKLIDRDYKYVMSMDEDGWLVGGGYKQFDYSGKMPYIDSSHTELLRVGSMDVDRGGTSIEQVYEAMESVSFDPFPFYPEYLKGGGGHRSGDNGNGGTPSGDVTLSISVVEVYEDDDSNYSTYENFITQLFSNMYDVGAGPCMDDDDTDPHISMARGVKFKGSYHMQQYYYNANLEVAVWQAMYPYGVIIGSPSYASFPPGGGGSREYVGYGNLYFFFDRANITKAFYPNRDLEETEEYYSTIISSGQSGPFYENVTDIDFNYGGSHDNKNNNDDDWEHDPYQWRSSMPHDFTDGWELPPNCEEEGETFVGIPLSHKSESILQSTKTFQNQFQFDQLIDYNYTYIKNFGTNHGWLIGEAIGNSIGSIVDKDTSHIPLFYLGTTNPNAGGMDLSDMIKVIKKIQFGALYIKPAFVFVDSNTGHLKLQFEADPTSSMGYLYDNLCKMLGITWNSNRPYNSQGLYTSCSMHAAGDRASYGCGPSGSNSGGFCPQMTLAYAPKFASQDDAAAYISMANSYVDYWRQLYPTGIAVGTEDFCPSKYYLRNGYGAVGGGCLGLFLNRYDLYYVFAPDLSGSWVEFNGMSIAPTYSPAPTWEGGCDDPHNHKLDKCYRMQYAVSQSNSMIFWDSLGPIGQLSVMLLTFMASALFFSIFAARFKKRRRPGESCLAFFWRDCCCKKKRRRRIRRVIRRSELQEKMVNDTPSYDLEDSATEGNCTEDGSYTDSSHTDGNYTDGTNTDGTLTSESSYYGGHSSASVAGSTRTNGTNNRSQRSRSRSVNSRRSGGSSKYGYRPNKTPKAIRPEVLQPHTLAADSYSEPMGSIVAGDAMSLGAKSSRSVKSSRTSRSGRSARSEKSASGKQSVSTSVSPSRSRTSSRSRSAGSRSRRSRKGDDASSIASGLITARSTQSHRIQQEEENFFGGTYA